MPKKLLYYLLLFIIILILADKIDFPVNNMRNWGDCWGGMKTVSGRLVPDGTMQCADNFQLSPVLYLINIIFWSFVFIVINLIVKKMKVKKT